MGGSRADREYTTPRVILFRHVTIWPNPVQNLVTHHAVAPRVIRILAPPAMVSSGDRIELDQREVGA